jgi:hypothetical protein
MKKVIYVCDWCGVEALARDDEGLFADYVEKKR